MLSESAIAATFPSTDGAASADDGNVRSRNLLHQDGVVIASIIRALDSLGVLETGPGWQSAFPRPAT